MENSCQKTELEQEERERALGWEDLEGHPGELSERSKKNDHLREDQE